MFHNQLKMTIVVDYLKPPYTVDAGYRNTGYKNIPGIRTISLGTESSLYNSIKKIPDIRTCFFELSVIRTFCDKTSNMCTNKSVILLGYHPDFA